METPIRYIMQGDGVLSQEIMERMDSVPFVGW